MCDRFIKLYKNPFLYERPEKYYGKVTKKEWVYLCSLIRNASTVLSNNQLPKRYFSYDKLNEDISHMGILWYIKYNRRVRTYSHKMIGFLLAIEDDDDDSIMIDSLCCHYMKRSGTLLMTWFMNYCKDLYIKIELYSLLSTLNYYRRFNFIHSKDYENEDSDITKLYNNILSIKYPNEEMTYNILKYEKALHYKNIELLYNDSIKKYFDLDYLPEEPMFRYLQFDEKYFNKHSIVNGENGLYTLVNLLIKKKFTKEYCTSRQLFMNETDYTDDGFYMVFYIE
tara:strand:- start:366 stop:1211 length:846 start_codon:yes stop_codon:yes gene_type:complete